MGVGRGGHAACVGSKAVVVLGDISLDAVMAIDALPQPGRESFAQQVALRPGGSAAGSAVVLARLGVPARLLACCGQDAWAELVLSAVADAGVDIGGVQRSAEAVTGLSFVAVTPDGERTMYTCRGANTRLDPIAIGDMVFAGAGALHLSGYALLEAPQRQALWQAVALARRGGVALSLDTALDPALHCPNEMRKLLPGLALCAMGVDEARVLLGSADPERATDRLLAQPVSLTALKLGGEGCLLATTGERVRFPALAAETVDATGAGDAFCAGLLFGWLRGLSLPAIAFLAAGLGALATTVYGGATMLPAGKTLLKFMVGQRSTALRVIPAEACDQALEELRIATNHS